MIFCVIGYIASGKSRFTTDLKAFGFHYIDADQIALEVSQPDGAAYPKLLQSFPNF